MPEFLIRSGQLCAVVEADTGGDAVQSAIANWKDHDDGVLELGSVTQVLPLEDCDHHSIYLPTATMLTGMGFKEPESCGLAVTSTSIS